MFLKNNRRKKDNAAAVKNKGYFAGTAKKPGG